MTNCLIFFRFYWVTEILKVSICFRRCANSYKHPDACCGGIDFENEEHRCSVVDPIYRGDHCLVAIGLLASGGSAIEGIRYPFERNAAIFSMRIHHVAKSISRTKKTGLPLLIRYIPMTFVGRLLVFSHAEVAASKPFDANSWETQHFVG